MGNLQFQNTNRHIIVNFGRNNVIRIGQMQVQKRGFSIRVIVTNNFFFGLNRINNSDTEAAFLDLHCPITYCNFPESRII